MTDGFCLYTCNHGQHLSSIKVASKGQMVAVPSLPCPNLRQLDVEGCCVTLSGATAGIVQTCSGLTYLRLERCRVAGQRPSIAPFAALTKLQHLELNLEGQVVALDVPSTLLLSLTKLTHLGFALDKKLATQAWLQQLSSLTHLQELSVSQYGSVCSPSTTPGLSRLTALTSLRLGSVSLDPSLLRDISKQLQSLHLSGVLLVAGGPNPLPVAPGGVSRLLSCIAGMTRLQNLYLDALPHLPGLTKQQPTQHSQPAATCTGWSWMATAGRTAFGRRCSPQGAHGPTCR
jgi:hypothetical protein